MLVKGLVTVMVTGGAVRGELPPLHVAPTTLEPAAVAVAAPEVGLMLRIPELDVQVVFQNQSVNTGLNGKTSAVRALRRRLRP
jgi:hypothetical protein